MNRNYTHEQQRVMNLLLLGEIAPRQARHICLIHPLFGNGDGGHYTTATMFILCAFFWGGYVKERY